ncbi:hypothetical protein LCGC14_0194420 [marine sediment metagenome]|uniref:Uncharacterized protein n=1 Tax=marine sediment metagenome TaxID=412755 RepID=A0A0F9UK29_9ZZZZ|nr:hypothetical protein [bacterium]
MAGKERQKTINVKHGRKNHQLTFVRSADDKVKRDKAVKGMKGPKGDYKKGLVRSRKVKSRTEKGGVSYRIYGKKRLGKK